MTEPSVYLDNNATTRPDRTVVDAMLPYLREEYGNPSSPYRLARSAALALDEARRRVAELIGAGDPARIVFTSGGTESNATAISGALRAMAPRNEIILSAVEHAAVRAWIPRLEAEGFIVTVVPVNTAGELDMTRVREALSERTALVSVMAANNETGVLYPVKRLAELAHEAGALMHSDIVQAAGKIVLHVERLGIDLASISSHKHHGPKGIGALYVSGSVRLPPFMPGGEQEGGRRPGTEAVHQIAGMGRAAVLASEWLSGPGPKAMDRLRDDFESRLLDTCSGVRIAGAGLPRLPNTTLALFDRVETEPLLALLDMEGIACSSGSACSSGAHEPSHVLRAMKLECDERGAPRGVLRISSSRWTRAEDYDRLLAVLPGIIDHLRT